MKTTERSEFGQRVLAAREHAGLSQQELAGMVGMTQNNLSHLERKGQGTPKVEAIARACGVRVAWLARGELPMVEPSGTAAAAQAAEALAAYNAPNAAKDFRTVCFTLAASLERTGIELPLPKFLDLADRLYQDLNKS